MATKLIGVKEFRMNLTKVINEANKKGVRFIVLKKNVPVLEVKGISKKNTTLEKLAVDIAEAREQVKKGEVYKLEEVKKELGL